MRANRNHKVIAVGTATLAVGGAVVWGGLATAADVTTTIRGCVSNSTGVMRILRDDQTCKSGERLLTWSVTGPPGPQGLPGSPGEPGAAGATGAQGIQGVPGAQGEKGDPGTTTGPPPATPVGVLTVDGIPIPVTVLAYSWGASNSGSAALGGAGVGKANIQDLSLTKVTDDASVAFIRSTFTGRLFRSGLLTVCVPTDCAATTEVTYALGDVLVSSVSTGGSSLATSPLTENVTLNFRTLTVTRGADSVSHDAAAS